MIPPAYDIILENPIEKPEDTRATIDLLYEIPRPFTLNIYALRLIPNTQLTKDIENKGFDVASIKNSYHAGFYRTFGNIMVFALTIFRIPQWLYKILRKKVYPVQEKQPNYPILFWLTRMIYLVKRAFSHLRFMDFSILPGSTGYFLWKIGVIRFWQRFMLKRYHLLEKDL